MPPTSTFSPRHRRLIEEAAANLVAVADDSGESLVSVIAAMERHIVEATKVGDARVDEIHPGRRGYTLREDRLVEH